MATERDFELLDDYVANRLGGEDKSAFERQLQADPDLQSEHLMQQRMVKAIKDARVAELKTMLNNTPVPAGNSGGTSVVAKFAIGTFVAGLVATGVYFYLNQEEETNTPEQTIELSSEGEQSIKADQTENTSDETSVTEEGKNESVSNEGTSEKELTAGENLTSAKPEIDVYDPTAELKESEDVEEPAGDRRNSVRTSAPTIAVQVERGDRKYTFDYKFTDGKLVLYGPFEKNLYEIMEFFSDEKRTVFLYYRNNYYLLKDDNDKVKELTAITDVNLIRKLKEYRGN